MNRKWLPFLIIIVLGVVLFFVRRAQDQDTPVPSAKKDRPVSNDPASSTDRNRGFDRRISYIEYTRHAQCRMECRKISPAEVEQIMREGKINYKKSDLQDRPCPTYALEGITRDNQRVRIVFAQCDQKSKVVTCIDLDTDWECHCPGDDDKYKNKR